MCSVDAGLSPMFGELAHHPVPTFGIEPPDQVLAKHRAAGEADDIGLCIETRLTMDGEEATFGGHLVMLPNQGALRSLLDALKV